VANRQYGLTIESAAGQTVAWAQSATSARLQFGLNQTSTFQVTFNASSADALSLYTVLQTTLPVVRLARDGIVVFTGPLESLEMTAGDGGDISATFTDWTGPMSHQLAFDTPAASSVNTLVDYVLGNTSVYQQIKWPQNTTRLTRSTVSSVSGTVYCDTGTATNVREMLDAAALSANFDWYVNHATAQFKVAPNLGSDKSATLTFGCGEIASGPSWANCTSARVTMQPPRNVVLAESDNNNRGFAPASYDSTAIANYPSSLNATWESLYNYGEFFESVSAGTHSATSVAANYLKNSPRQTVEVVADPVLAPQWGVSSDYYLGDTVNVTVQQPAYTLNGAYRINEIAVELDDQLVETSNSLQFEVV
jgi:hypothetical protein